MHARRPQAPISPLCGIIFGLLHILITSSSLLAQLAQENPVYLADSPGAADALERAEDLAAVGNLTEAAEIIQQLLSLDEVRLVPSAQDERVYVSVRGAASEVLRRRGPLLERYRDVYEMEAKQLLDAGRVDVVERSYLHTQAGMEAALLIAQSHVESADFSAAIHTLLQLQGHRDVDAGVALDAVGILSLASMALETKQATPTTDAVSRLIDVWSDLALEAPPMPDLKPPAVAKRSDPVLGGEPVELSGLLPSPLAISDIVEAFPDEADTTPLDPNLAIWPTVHDGLVFASTGDSVQAWDRFTLARRWSVRVAKTGDTGGFGGSIELAEPTNVAVRGGTLVTVAAQSDRTRSVASEQRIVLALDADTGRQRWTRTTREVTGGSPAGLTLRSSPVLSQSTVVVLGSLYDRSRRANSAYAFGIDRDSGETRWRFVLGSIGQIGGSVAEMPGDRSLHEHGVVYIREPLGVIAAVETYTGRPLWVRKAPVSGNRLTRPEPWEVHAPVLLNGTLYVLSPDLKRLLAIDPESGTLRFERSVSSSRLLYIVETRGVLIGVSEDTLYRLPTTRDDPSGPTVVFRPSDAAPSSDSREIRGRVVRQGDSLLIPVSDGAYVIDPTSELTPESVSFYELDHTGHVVATRESLIAVGQGKIASYLLWGQAEALLRDRMERDPDDVAAFATFAELAFHAGEMPLVLPALDHAIERARSFDDALGRQSSDMIFRVMSDILAFDLGPGSRAGAADATLLRSLCDRLKSIAVTPAQRVQHAMGAGRVLELIGDDRAAIDLYQDVVETPELRDMPAGGSQVSTTAGAVVLDNMREILRRSGRQVYARHETRAEAALASLGDTEDTAELEDIGVSFPFSTHAVRALMRAAALHEQNDRTTRSMATLRRALSSAEVSDDESLTLTGTVASSLILLAENYGMPGPAAFAIGRLAAKQPDLEINVRGEIRTAEEVLTSLHALLRPSLSTTKIGPAFAGSRTISGWRIERPFVQVNEPLPRGHVVLRSSDGALGVLRSDRDGDAQIAWEISLRQSVLLHSDERAIYVGQKTQPGNSIDEKIVALDIETGNVLWTTPELRRSELMPDAPNRQSDERKEFPVTLQGSVSRNELVTTFLPRTLIVAERGGMLAAFDRREGTLRWAIDTQLTQIHDVSASSGVVSVAGVRKTQGEDALAIIQSFEALGGHELSRTTLHEVPLWIRSDDAGDVIAGFTDRLTRIDVVSGQPSWSLQVAELRAPTDAWTNVDALMVRDIDNSLWLLDGDPDADSARTVGKNVAALLEPGFDTLRVRPHKDGFMVSTAYGVGVVGADGTLIARDAPPFFGDLLPASFAEGRAVTVQRNGRRIDSGLYGYLISMLDIESLIVTDAIEVPLPERPRDLRVLDGVIVVSSRSLTTLLGAPSRDD